MKKFEEVYNDLNSVTMIITNRCNLACDYCFERSKGNIDMDVDTALEIVDRTYNKVLMPNQRFTYNLFGGEPMVNWKVVKAILDHINAKHYNAQVGITTNMTHMTDEMLDYIDDNDVFILASIDGIKEMHDLHRKDHGGNGSFDTVINNMQKMIDRGLAHLLEARMTVTPENAKYMYDGVKMLIDMGVNNICPIAASDLEWNEEALQDYKENYEKTLELYLQILNDTENHRNINIKHIDDIIGTALEPEVSDTKMCHIGNKYWLCVDWNMDIYPCHNFPTTDLDFLKEMKIGNMRTGIDESKVSCEAKQAKFEMEECNTCEARVICKSGCPFQNMTENHDFYTPTKGYCDIQRVLVNSAMKFRDELLSAENIRSRKLNVLIENLKLKKYFDDEVKNADIVDIGFRMKLDRFLELYNNLEYKGNVIPSFNDYFTYQLSLLTAIIATVNNSSLDDLEETNAK